MVREEFKDKVGVIMSQIYIISSRLREMRKKEGLHNRTFQRESEFQEAPLQAGNLAYVSQMLWK